MRLPRLVSNAVCLAVFSAIAVPASAAAIAPSASQRFASPTDETPSFQRHVLPLMGRLGCNGRACHGSFQGQGGFRLSLFGYDFDADHAALVEGDAPRVDLKNVDESLMLYKPTHEDEHGGGERMKVGSWQYNLMRQWVESGAPSVKPDDAEFVKLEVTPREIQFAETGEKIALKALAYWSDGAVEDVTHLCRFQTNDETVAVASEDGVIQSVGKGDTYVVAFYDNGVVPVAVMRPVSDQVGPKYPRVAAPTKIDELVVDKLRKLGIVPSDLSTDEEFLRRASLDITGTLPTAREVLTFTADRTSNKRAKKIEELLARPAYAAWWTTKLCDLTGNREREVIEPGLRREYTEQWYQWIHRRVEENTPYDELVAGIVLATSRDPDQSYEDYCEEMSAYFWKENATDFSERETLPHYWTRRNLRTANERALGFSYTFLGVRLQCAECHKHPFDQWSQQDFQQFTAFFEPIRSGRQSQDRDVYAALTEKLVGKPEQITAKIRQEMAAKMKDGGIMPFQEMFITKTAAMRPQPKNKKAVTGSRVITPHVLGGDEVLLTEYSDPREPIMEWLRHPENPYFAKALVNRVWAQYFGVGIVDPPDDMNLANAPSNRELLDYLAAEFIRHDFDMKWLHREIANSRTYQLSWRPNETNVNDGRNFSRALPRRMAAEAAYDAVVSATAGSKELAERRDDPILKCAIGLSPGYTNLTGGNASGSQYALAVFGKPMRETPCDCERSNEATLLQTVFLRNDTEVLTMIDRRGGWLAEAVPETPKKVATKATTANLARGKKGPRMSSVLRNELQESLTTLEKQLDRAREKGDVAAAKNYQQRIKTLRAKLGMPAGSSSSTRPVAASVPRAPVSETALIRDAYLRTLSRAPSTAELSTARRHLESAETTKDGLRDLLWALLNTKEFIVNH